MRFSKKLFFAKIDSFVKLDQVFKHLKNFHNYFHYFPTSSKLINLILIWNLVYEILSNNQMSLIKLW